MKRLTVVAILAALMAMAFATPVLATHGGGLNCDDFVYKEDAQAHLEAHPGDPDGLDGNDNDGLACEHLPSRGTQSTDTGTTGGGATTLPSTGTGGYLGSDTLGLSPVTLLVGALALGVSLVSGGLVFRRSLR